MEATRKEGIEKLVEQINRLRANVNARKDGRVELTRLRRVLAGALVGPGPKRGSSNN